jgi:periplasmic protein TonB
MTDKEKKDKKMGMITSGVFHGLLLLLFLILVAWREPNPPLPEYGIELNLGFEDAGSGDNQSTEPAEVENTEEDTPDAEEITEDVEEEIIEDDPAEEIVDPVEEIPDPVPVVVEKPVEEDPIETTEEEVVETQVDPNEVKVEDKKEETTEEVKEEVVTPPKEEKKEEVVKPKPKPTVDKRALMGGKKTDSNTDAASKSEGTDANKVGNEGDPEGAVDQRGLMKGGGAGGPVLDLTGWTWNTRPNPDDASQETGKIVFKITIDDRGQVLRVQLVESTVSAALVRVYQKEVERVSFKPLGSNARPAPTSEGNITFIIKTN